MSISDTSAIFGINKRAVFGMVVSTAVCIVLNTICSNALLLNHYAINIVPLYFFAQAVLIASLSYTLRDALIFNVKQVLIKVSLYAIASILILAVGSIWFDWAPFALAVLLSTINAFLGLLTWQVVSSNSDLQLYRSALSVTTQWSIISGLVCGIVVALLLSYLPIWVFYGLICVSLSFVSLFANQIKNLLLRPLDRAWNISTMSYALYTQLFTYLVLLFLAQVLIDYNLKKSLIDLEMVSIVRVLGYYFAASSFGALIIFKVYSQQVIKQQGVVSLLAIFPVVLWLLSMGFYFFHSTWLIGLMVVSQLAITYSCTLLGRKLMLHILPNAIRFKGKLQIRKIATPLAMCLGAAIITMIEHFQFTQSTAPWLIIISLALIFSLKNLSKVYSDTLKTGISLRRIQFSEELSEQDHETAHQLALKELLCDDERSIMSGINLLYKINPPKLPQRIFELIKTQGELIKLRLIELFTISPDSQGILYMTHQVALESDPNILWHLYNGISQFDTKQALLIARKNWDKQITPQKAGIIKIFLEAGNMDEILESASALNSMLISKDDKLRLFAAHIMGSLKVGSPEKELKKLIQDEQLDVAKAAMNASAIGGFKGLIPVIVGRLNHPQLGYSAHSALLVFGDDVIPYVRTKLRFCSAHEARSLIKLIASIPSEHAERALMGLSEDRNIFVRTLSVQEYLYRLKNVPMMDDFLTFAHRMAYVEVELAKTYLSLYQRVNEIANLKNESILLELDARIRLAKIRILLWASMLSNPEEIGPHVKDMVDNTNDKNRIQLKMHYLNVLSHELRDSNLKKQIFNIIQMDRNSAAISKILASNALKDIQDIQDIPDHHLVNLLTVDLNKRGEKFVELLDKVFLLRKTEVFKDLPSEVLLAVAKAIKEKDFLKGEVIFRQNDMADGLYIIVSGVIKICAGEKVLKFHQPKDVFGEVGLIDGTRRSADAIGDSDGVMLFIDEITFESITNDFPEILRKFTRIIIGHLHKMLEPTSK